MLNCITIGKLGFQNETKCSNLRLLTFLSLKIEIFKLTWQAPLMTNELEFVDFYLNPPLFTPTGLICEHDFIEILLKP